MINCFNNVHSKWKCLKKTVELRLFFLFYMYILDYKHILIALLGLGFGCWLLQNFFILLFPGHLI